MKKEDDNHSVGVIKSSEAVVHRFSDATNSAVSEPAVEHSVRADGFSSKPMHTEPRPDGNIGQGNPEPASGLSSGERAQDASGEDLGSAMTSTIVSAEKCISDLEQAVGRAADLVAEVRNAAANLSLNDDLRERLRATMAKTQSLRKK